MANIYMTIDTSELDELVEFMRSRLTPDEFERLMRRTLNEVGKRSKKPIRDAVRTEYDAKAGWINAAIKSSKVTGGGSSLSCVIPLQNARGTSGTVFAAGGRRSRGFIRKGDRHKVWLRDVLGVNSVLPYHMGSYGGQPPFLNVGKTIMTRAGKARLPIRPVVGLALPQMPLNRAADETQEKILELAEKRVVHNFSHMFDR